MAAETKAIDKRNRIELGKYDFSQYRAVTDAAAPGTLIRTHTTNMEVNVTDVTIYNPAAAAVITFYDEDSNVKLVVSVGNLETLNLGLKASLVYGEHDIYARSDQAGGADVTVAGKESFPT